MLGTKAARGLLETASQNLRKKRVKHVCCTVNAAPQFNATM